MRVVATALPSGNILSFLRVENDKNRSGHSSELTSSKTEKKKRNKRGVNTGNRALTLGQLSDKLDEVRLYAESSKLHRRHGTLGATMELRRVAMKLSFLQRRDRIGLLPQSSFPGPQDIQDLY